LKDSFVGMPESGGRDARCVRAACGMYECNEP
jgi:hypothetical protein